MNSEDYIKIRRKRIEFYARLNLGMQQLIQKPHNVFVILAIVVAFVIVWRYKNVVISTLGIPAMLLPMFQYTVSIILIVLLILSVLGVLKTLGILASRYDEACLIMAFSSSDLRHGHPILISRKRLKGTKVIVREFYSTIPMKSWLAIQDSIADALNSTFVTPYTTYGGRNKDNGNRIVIYTKVGRSQKESKMIYDEI